MKDVVLLIPTLEPNEEFILFLKNAKKTFENIVVVNDGSSKKYNNTFLEIENLGIIVLKNYINLGKGRAIKNGINYTLNSYTNIKSIVTADSDGQHTIDDIIKCAKASLENQNHLILGVRNFNETHVPFRSKFGNIATRNIFNFFLGIEITDTQTGLRAFSKNLAVKFMETSGERFDYETNMLIDTIDHQIKIKEVKIKTVYLFGNKSSHFSPIKDSIMIYKTFVKYVFSAISSFAIDIILFTLLFTTLHQFIGIEAIIYATIMARIISSLFNYFVNAKVVFKGSPNNSTIIKYYILVIIQMFISAALVYIIKKTLIKIDTTFIKIVVDSIIFIINFYIQREFIFKQKREIR